MPNNRTLCVKTLCILVLTGLSLVKPVWASGLDGALNDVFNGMSNTTQAGSYETQRRGVLAGGGTVARSKVMNVNMMSFTPPSFKAGCGGIDLYLGSFSYINKEQFIQFLRSVAANAIGYAFQVALQGTCPDCMNAINKLSDTLEKINSRMGNSCELAQGIVNDTFGGWHKERQTKASLTATRKGIYDDFASTWLQTDGKTQAEKIEESDKTLAKQVLYGNVIWRAMKDADLKVMLLSGNGDDLLLESIMSITGTHVYGDLKSDGTGKSPEFKTYVPLMGITELVEGSINGQGIKRYGCDTHTNDGCLHPIQKEDMKLDGLMTRLRDVLRGKDGNIGIIGKFASPNQSGLTLTDAEKRYFAAIPNSAGAVIRNLAINSEEAAELAAETMIGAVATELAMGVTWEFLTAVEASLVKEKDDGKKGPILKQIKERKVELIKEYEILVNKYGRLADRLQATESIGRLVQRLDVTYFPRTSAKNTNSGSM